LYNESSSDSSYEANGESSSEEEVVEEYDDSDSKQQALEEDDKKPPPTRLFLELESLKKCMEKNCRCPKCNGPVEMKVKTLCLASNVMVCCMKKDCGYIDVSNLPATAEIGAKVLDDRNRSTDYSIKNVLYENRLREPSIDEMAPRQEKSSAKRNTQQASGLTNYQKT
jgi:hypothetical protein